MNDPILDEIHAVRRQHWLEAGGTWEGLCDCYDRLSAEMDEKGPETVFRELLAARNRARLAREAEGAMCVGEEPGAYEAGLSHTEARRDGDTEGEKANAEARRGGSGEWEAMGDGEAPRSKISTLDAGRKAGGMKEKAVDLAGRNEVER